MFPSEPEDIISIIGSNFIFPITSLLEALDEHEVKGPNEVKSSSIENGYSIGIIVLAVLMTESAIYRTQYMMKTSPPKKPLNFIKTTTFTENMYDVMEEIFVLRDVIAHNHIWEAKLNWDENVKMRLLSAQIVDGYGDNKYKKVIDKNKRVTRLLRLNLFPIRICRSDAVIVLKKVVEFLLSLENNDHNYFVLSNQWVNYRGIIVDFEKLISGLSF